MAKPLPKWVMQKYALLWNRFSESRFDHAQAAEVVGKGLASVIINNLKGCGWVDVALQEHDGRKRTYQLKGPEKAVKEMADDD